MMLDEMLASLNIIKILSDLDKYEIWLKKEHEIELDGQILRGLKTILVGAVRLFLFAISNDTETGIKEDYVFFRARFEGIPIEEVPNTSDKIVFVKNVWKFSNAVLKAKNISELKNALEEIKPLTHLMNEIYKKAKLKNSKIRKCVALRAVTQICLSTYFHDTEYGFPKVFIFPSFIRFSPKTECPNEAFRGYVIALDYLWYNLTGPKNHKRISSELKKALSWKKGKWMRFDTTFTMASTLAVKSTIEMAPSAGFDGIFKSIEGEITSFKPLLSRNGLEEPKYLRNRKDWQSIKKFLDYKFLWYDAEVLNRNNSIFGGIHAFLITLWGLIKYIGKDDKAIVRVFKHPHGKNENRYSYAILLNVFGSLGLSDYSGWLVFYDCATDYSGAGGFSYEEAKMTLEILEKKEMIEVETIEVKLKDFSRYLDKFITKSQKATGARKAIADDKDNLYEIYEEIKEILKELGDNLGIIDNTRGIVFELLVYKYLIETKINAEVEIIHNEIYNKQQIDIIIKNENEKLIQLIECKIDIHNGKKDEMIRKIKGKLEDMRKSYPDFKTEAIIVTYLELRPEIIEFFKKQSIEVVDNFKNKIIKSRLLPKENKKLIIKFIELNRGNRDIFSHYDFLTELFFGIDVRN